MYIIQIEKGPTENTLSVLRRFTKKVRGGSFLQAVRSRQYRVREDSTLRRKRRALNALEKTRHYEQLRKLGKLTEEEKKKR